LLKDLDCGRLLPLVPGSLLPVDRSEADKFTVITTGSLLPCKVDCVEGIIRFSYRQHPGYDERQQGCRIPGCL
jgi:hypothetical protein